MNLSRSRTLRPVPPLLFLFFAASLAMAQTPPYLRTVVVSPVAGDPVASGDALLAALDGIPSPSASDPWLLKIEPGIYDVGTQTLQMRPFVDIEGSGPQVTTIQGLGNDEVEAMVRGVVQGADNAELRDLTVNARPAAGRDLLLSIINISVSPSIRNVHTAAQSGTVCYGIRNLGSSPEIDQVSILTQCSAENNGIVNAGDLEASRPRIQRTEIKAIGASINRGIMNRDASLAVLVRDVQISVSGPSLNHGIASGHGAGGAVQGKEFHIEESAILASGGTQNAGIYIEEGNLRVEHSTVNAGAGSSYSNGIRDVGGNGTARVQNSRINGTTNTIYSTFQVWAGASKLVGGPVFALGLSKCAGVYDENFDFFASTCP